MRKTEHQTNFDLTKHGWAFCNQAGLAWRIAQLEQIAPHLHPTDPRHTILAEMREVAKDAECISLKTK